MIHGDHAALLLFPAGCVLQEQSLLGSYHALQGQQRAMRIDHKCLRAFVELWAFFRRSVHDNGNVQIYPTTAAAFQPQRCFGRFLVVHTDKNKTLSPVR